MSWGVGCEPRPGSGRGEAAHLEEVLDALRVVAVALATDPLHLLDLARLARRLDVLEVHVGVLAVVDDRAEEVEQACDNAHTQCISIQSFKHRYGEKSHFNND